MKPAIKKFDPNRSASLATHIRHSLQYEILNIKKRHKPHGISGVPKDFRLNFLYLDNLQAISQDDSISYAPRTASAMEKYCKKEKYRRLSCNDEHSDMGVSPSDTDDKHRQKILDQLEKDMFYIFMVWNKSLSVHTLIYDMTRNVLYEDRDVTVKLVGDEAMDAFLADTKEKVQKPSYKRNQSGKTKSVSKKQKAKQLGLDAEFEELDELGLSGAEVDLEDIEDAEELEELRQLGPDDYQEEFSHYSRYGLYNPYDLAGSVCRD